MTAPLSPSVEAMKAHVDDVAELLRLLGTPTRLLLLCQIAQRESSVAELERELGLKQPGLSQQLAELRQRGVVSTRRESRSIFYSIADDRVRALLGALYGIFCSDDNAASTAPTTVVASARRPGDAARFATVARR